ncbi:MAG: right-handed parallel beta-helix repeat-containing protein, partial [Fuerstiella sp.]
MTSRDEIIDPPAPVLPAGQDSNTGKQNAPAQVPNPENGDAGNTAPENQGGRAGNFSPPTDFTPYFEQSFGATESPVLGRRVVNNPLFGPQLMFESNVGEGLGFNESYQRLNARIPYHVVPGNSVLIGDLSASLTNDRGEAYNFGLIWRNYDATRNRVFGWNVYGDIDDGRQNQRWKRFGVGMESLGKYIDFFANGYFVSGTDSVLLNSSLGTDLSLGGNSAFRTRTSTWDNAYSGGDFEVGGPLPLLGRRGINAYAGGYYLDNDKGYETFGYSARVQALVTQSATVDVRYTGDDTFGDNLWVSLAYTIPNYRERAIMQPKRVRDRLADPVYRSNRIHTNMDVVNTAEALFNAAKGRAFNVVYVDPDATSTTAAGNGAGTLEDPFTSLMVAAMNNNAGIDVINVNPRDDDSNTNLTVNGGLALFDCQVLRSTTEAYTLDTIAGTNFIIPAVAAGTGLGASIANPTMVAGGSVIRLSNENTVLGMRIDASNTAMTVFGTGITNPLPFTDATILRNTFTNYETAVNLVDGSGTIILDGNTATGLSGASMSGLVLTTASGSTTELLVRNNTVSNNSVVGISVTAGLNSMINADRPTGVGPGGTSVQPTGIVGNTVTNGGQGIVVAGQTGSTINAVVQDNTSTGNTFDGFVGRADGSTFNLFSMANNTFSSNLANGALIEYQNGGLFMAITEDLDGDGIMDPGEDLNENGLLDEGIVSNTMNDNSIAGLCLFGHDASTGLFAIGGPQQALGNTLQGNAGAGLAVDLQDTATAQIDALFNTTQGGNAAAGLTIVLDFVDATQGSVVDGLGRTVNPFDITQYGFAATDFGTVTNAITQTIQSYYHTIPTVGQDTRSSIPDGMQLDLDFVIGDAGVAPSNGATEYYAVTIGDSAANLGGLAGQAADIGNIRNAQGLGPGQGLAGTPLALGASAAGVYTNGINQFSTLLNPPNAYTGPTYPAPIIVEDPSQTPQFAINALTSGNLTFTRRAIGLIAAHELGHSLSLRHIQQTGAATPSGLNTIMGTPAIDTSIQSLLEPAEFAFSGTNPGELPGEAPFLTRPIDQLVAAIGLRVASGATRNGITVTGTDNARLINSTFNNNTIVGATEHGINISMNDSARAEGLTIQGNTITNGAGHGVRLNADGAAAFIDADNTIGGSGSNTYRGTAFLQGNNISMNAGDGFRAIAANGGVIHGNLINNQLTQNGGNGATLSIDGSGTIDFGTPALNRIISGNTITGNSGIGIETVSTVSATGTGLLNAVIQNNDISNN